MKPRRAQPFFHRHPWVFAGAIRQIVGDPQLGDEVALTTNDGKFIARGLFNPASNIRCRLYRWDENASINYDFLAARIDDALDLRSRLYPTTTETSAHRIVYSEGDHLSGLIVDRYGDYLSIQWSSAALMQHQESIMEILVDRLQPKGIWLRGDSKIQQQEGMILEDQCLYGEQPPAEIVIEENGLQITVEMMTGQKTGYYLDQTENRRVTATYLRGGRVLDLFCYTGGFALSAAKAGSEVLAVDSSEPALAAAARNAERNGLQNKITFEQSDVFEKVTSMLSGDERFEAIILDPPKMTRNTKNLERALKGYRFLNSSALKLLQPGGILVTCSCSGLIDRGMFEEMLSDVSLQVKRPLQILETRAASQDHPLSVHCPETDYLKCCICRVS